MKKITMLTTAAGPAGCHEAGKEYLVADDLADAFIAAGAAVAVEPEAVTPETSNAKPAAASKKGSAK